VAIDVRIDEVVLRALEKEPERRYQQASHVKERVETIAQTLAPGSRPLAEGPRPTTALVKVLGIFGMPALLLAIGFYTLYARSHSRIVPPDTEPTTAPSQPAKGPQINADAELPGAGPVAPAIQASVDGTGQAGARATQGLTVHYVSAANTRPVPPYTSWATAATNIQDAVDAARVPGALVMVGNGVYASGGRTVGANLLFNRVAVDKPLRLRSVNGPRFTIIEGRQVPGDTNGPGAVRCVYLTNGASLTGFTLTKGATRTVGDPYRDMRGAGLYCETNVMVTNCVLVGNVSATFSGGADGGTLFNCRLLNNVAYDTGGGACGGTLNSCTLSGNVAGFGGADGWDTLNNCLLTNNSAWKGGGSCWSTLNNCTIVRNTARGYGGGAFESRLNNCIVYYNTAPEGFNFLNSRLNYSCTAPMPAEGQGNFTNAPIFVNLAGGNLRLQANSPCINAGNNRYVTGATDLDGRPRIVYGTVDLGPYEDQSLLGTRIPHTEVKFTGQWRDAGVFRFSNEIGATAECAFEGTGVRWLGHRFDDAGRAEITIDGKSVGVVDQFGPGRDLPFDWTHHRLSPGRHTIRLRLRPDKPEQSKDRYLNVIGFEVLDVK
jgi:hypothetical protein